MNWTSIQKAVYDWIVGQTGYTTVWADQNAPRPAYPFIVLSIINERGLGVDEIRYTTNAGKLDPTVAGNRLFTVSIQVHGLDPAPANHPRNKTSLLRASLRKQTVMDVFKAAGLAVVRSEPAIPVDQVLEGRWISVNLIDVTLAAAENVADSAEDYIETVDGVGEFPPSTVTIEGPWGVGV